MPPILSHPVRSTLALLPDRFRSGLGRRAVAIGLTLLLELLLALMLLSLGRQDVRRKVVEMALSTFNVAPAAEPAPEPPAPAKAEPKPQPQAQPTPTPPAPATPTKAKAPTPPEHVWPWLQLSPQDMAAADLNKAPPRAAPAKPQAAGPADPGAAGDSRRVGTARNGQPLYAAAWYREPTNDELRGYLSTADGPGWGLIECRTAEAFRVEDCEALDEYPSGSRLSRAILAAAWQFRVRPPRVGGVYKVGEWVRIRIDYSLRPADRPS